MVRQISDILINMVVSMYKDDEPVSVIAEDLRLDKKTVLKYLREKGVYEEDLEHARKSTRRYSYVEKDRIIELYKEGVPVSDIAEELDTSESSLYLHINKEGLTRQSTQDDINRAVSLYQKDIYSVQEVLDKTGVARSTLYRHLKK